MNRFFGVSLIILLMLYTLPLRWSVMGLISAILCINRDFVTFAKQLCDSVHHENSSVDNNNGTAAKKENELNDILVISCNKPQGKLAGYILDKFWMNKDKFTRVGLERATSGLTCRRSTN